MFLRRRLIFNIKNMAKLVRTTRTDKDIMDLIKEVADLNPIECNYYQTKNGADVYKSVYSNGLWKKEVNLNSRRLTTYSAKIGSKIVYFETSETVVPIESIHNQVMDMFTDYSSGRLWVD